MPHVFYLPLIHRPMVEVGVSMPILQGRQAGKPMLFLGEDLKIGHLVEHW